MTFTEYYRNLNAEERKALAERMGISITQLRQFGSGCRKVGLRHLFSVPKATYGRVSLEEARK